MECDRLADLIDAYLDGELTASQQAAVARHLGGCPACASMVAAGMALRARIRAAGGHPLPAGLVGRVSRALDEPDTDGREPPWWRRHPWWLLGSHGAAAALGALALFLWLADGGRGGDMSGEALSAHLRGLAAAQTGPVTAGETHIVRPWFAGKIDFAPPVANLSAQGFPLLGGHVDYLGGRPAAALAYGRRLHRITLFVLPAATVPAAIPAAMTATNQRGYNLVHWRDEAFAYWAISDLNRAELTEFQRGFEAAVARPAAASP